MMQKGVKKRRIIKNQFSILWFLPLAGFVVLVTVISVRLLDNGQTGEGALSDIMVGQSAPILDLPFLEEGDFVQKPSSDWQGQLSLVNFWASWCAPCRVEHPFLMQLAQDNRLKVIGINYKDNRANAQSFLQQLGNPYTFVAVDARGTAAIEWGVYGVPESYLVDENGLILYRHIGPLDHTTLTEKILSAIK